MLMYLQGNSIVEVLIGFQFTWSHNRGSGQEYLMESVWIGNVESLRKYYLSNVYRLSSDGGIG